VRNTTAFCHDELTRLLVQYLSCLISSSDLLLDLRIKDNVQVLSNIGRHLQATENKQEINAQNMPRSMRRHVL